MSWTGFALAYLALRGFQGHPLLANAGEGTLLRNSLQPGSGTGIVAVKRCKISYLAAGLVVWVALHMSDVIVPLFLAGMQPW